VLDSSFCSFLATPEDMIVRKKVVTWKVEYSIISISREVMLGGRWRAFRVALKDIS
jgi:hypothetical protein